MQNGFIVLAGALIFTSQTLAVVGCSGSDSDSDAPTTTTGGSTITSGTSSATTGAGPATTGAGSTTTGGSTSTSTTGGATSTSTTGGGPLCMDGGTDVTSLCSTAPLNALSDAEEMQLCTETGTYIEGALTRANACRYYAIVTSASSSAPTVEEMQGVCAQAESDCNLDPTVMGPGRKTLCSQIPDSCAGTIAEYSECVADQAVVFDQGAGELVPCSELTFENLSSSYDVPLAANEASGCTALKAACPSFTLPYVN